MASSLQLRKVEEENTMASFKDGFERFTDTIFDDDFSPTAFHEEDGKLLGVEIRVNRGGKEYSLSVETLFLQMSRLAIDETAHTDDDPTMVVVSDEIHLSDLRRLKDSAIEELIPYLIEQD